MTFRRRMLAQVYADYTRYRADLRLDFRYRCAYCLTPEFFLGGEAGCEIDHHRPRRGPFARPDLVSVYENLYWCCRECNQNKGDTWPAPEEVEEGHRFLDPCRDEDDHDLHWSWNADGTLTALTPAGEYTIERLMLWRAQLVHHRRRQSSWQRERADLAALLDTREVPEAFAKELMQRLSELGEWIEPPVFDRPRRG